jgi:hypothetical protein
MATGEELFRGLGIMLEQTALWEILLLRGILG